MKLSNEHLHKFDIFIELQYIFTVHIYGFEATEYWPLICMEEGKQPGDLVISSGHGNAQEEYAMRRRTVHIFPMSTREITAH